MTNESPLAHSFSLSGLTEVSNIRLGLPMWFMAPWRGRLLSAGVRQGDALSEYSQVFSSAEGNTTFYGLLAAERAALWCRQVPPAFRFCFKIPQTISHAENMPAALQQEKAWLAEFLAVTGDMTGLLILQLPARTGPERLTELEAVLAELTAMSRVPLAVEVRNPHFFSKGEAEVQLLRLLASYHADRVIFDSRGLFQDHSLNDAVLDARSKKPRLPVHPLATGQNPVVRFIGHSDWRQNQRYLQQWALKLKQWLQEGRTPWLFIHTADNTDAPEFARWICQMLGLPSADWPGEQTPAGMSGDLFAPD